MKILFVYPNVTRVRSPQLGICMIGAVARDLGHECDLYDLTVVPAGKEVATFSAKLGQFRPDIIGVSCLSSQWPFVEGLFHSVDTGNVLKVFGGPHVSVAPEQVINLANVAVIGEGERTFAELLKRLTAKEDIRDIPGCWVRQGEKVVRNEMPQLIAHLDDLPVPYWALFDDVHYRDSYVKTRFNNADVIGAFERSRGCPFACTYCTNDYMRSLYKGKGLWRREKTPRRMIEELRLFRNQYGLDAVYWIDEVILTDVEKVKQFADLYLAEINRPFVFMERPENMTDKKVELIKQAGAQSVSIGIESGAERIRKTVLNRKMSQKTIVSAFHTARKHGLESHAFTMIGFPGEDRAAIKETLHLLREAQPDTLQTSIFFPLIGTKLYRRVVEEGLFDPTAPIPSDYYSGSKLAFSEKWKDELLRWQFILTNYKSKWNGLYVLDLPGPLFRLLLLLHKVGRALRRQGPLATLKAIHRKLRC